MGLDGGLADNGGLSVGQLPASVAIKSSPNTFTATQQIGSGATALVLNTTPGITVAGSVQIGNLITDRSLTRSLSVEYGRTIAPSDFEDVHGALILGSLQGLSTTVQTGTVTNGSAVVTGLSDTSVLKVPNLISGTNIPAGTRIQSIDSPTQITMNQNATPGSGAVSLTFTSNHGQAFGAEIQGQTNNVAGIAANSIIGVNGIGLHMSDSTLASGTYVAGVTGIAQTGNSGTPTIVGTIDLAVGVMGMAVQQFGNPYTITKAVSLYAKAQTAGTLNIGVYSEDQMMTATGKSLGLGMGLSNGSPGARLVVYDGGTHYGSGAPSNQGTGVVTGITKLCFTNDGNNPPRIFVSGTNLLVQVGSSGLTVENGSGSIGLKVSASTSPSVIVGPGSALATSATDGFLYLPTCAGTPTGVPTTQTGSNAMVYDTTAHKIWVYDSGWKGVVVA